MNAIGLAIAVLLPVFGGILIPLLPFRGRTGRLVYTEGVVLATSALMFIC